MKELARDERYMGAGTKARVRIEKPDDVRLSFELTMTAAEWRHLMRQLPSDGSAAGQLGLMISRMLGDTLGRIETGWLAGAHFSAIVEPEAAPAPEEDAPR